eukprot:70224-Rhodomonas_salina.1
MTEGLDHDGSAQKTRVSIFLVLIDMGQVTSARILRVSLAILDTDAARGARCCERSRTRSTGGLPIRATQWHGSTSSSSSQSWYARAAQHEHALTLACCSDLWLPHLDCPPDFFLLALLSSLPPPPSVGESDSTHRLLPRRCRPHHR